MLSLRSFFRLISLQAALPLFFCVVLFLCGGRAAEAGSFPLSFGNGATLSETAAPAVSPLALGAGSREREALATRNVQETSSTEQLFQGSFLGALFFGYPYTGLSTIDFFAMGLLLLFVVRAVAARRRDQEGDRFSVDRPDLNNNQDRPGERDERPRTRVEDLRPTETGKKQDGASGNSRDNAWSRRLRGEKNPQRPQGGRPTTVQENAAAMWAGLSSTAQQQEVQAPSVAAGVKVPAHFDVHEFLEGARTLYVRLQQAWASRKVDALAPFISPQMLTLLQKQAAANPDPVPVEILLVNATLNKVTSENRTEKAEVAFSVVMRSGEEEEPTEVDEIWLFARGDDFGDMWQLTGIRQA